MCLTIKRRQFFVLKSVSNPTSTMPMNGGEGGAVSSTNHFSLKGSDRLCKVVELSMQYCGKLLSDSFETYY